MSSWSPEGCPGNGAGFVLTDGAGWDPVCIENENGIWWLGLPSSFPSLFPVGFLW